MRKCVRVSSMMMQNAVAHTLALDKHAPHFDALGSESYGRDLGGRQETFFLVQCDGLDGTIYSGAQAR